MEKTTNYQLNKPEATDPMRVSDFNENADIIDGLLNTLNTAVAALNTAAAGFGNCKIASGSYTGNGKYGSGNPTTLTFEFEPKMVVIWTENYKAASTGSTTTRVGFWGPTFAVLLPNVSKLHYGTGGNDATVTNISFSGNTVQYYNDTSYANCQWNTSGTIYYYLAFGV